MTFASVLERIRAERGHGCRVPNFEPRNGNELARVLFVFEAPGRRAAVDGGVVSQYNNDPSAANFKRQLAEARIDGCHIAIWNVVPWYVGNADGTRIRAVTSKDVKEGCDWLSAIINEMEKLEIVVLVGGAARKALVHLSGDTKFTARTLSCHHTSAQSMLREGAWEENVAVLRQVASLLQRD